MRPSWAGIGLWAFFALILPACRRAPPEDPGRLTPLVAAKALTDRTELARILEVEGHELPKRIGAHEVRETLTLRTTAGTIEEVLRDTAHLVATQAGSFEGTHENSRDYGRKVTFTGTQLFVRMRHGPAILRRPEFGETEALHNELTGLTPALMRLIGDAAHASDGGKTTKDGRPVVRIELSKRDAEDSTRSFRPEQAWRQHMKVLELKGELLVDERSGVPLSVALSTRYEFPMKASTATVEAKLERQVTPLGADPEVAPPKDAVTGPKRPRYEPERRALLKGLDGRP